MVVLHIQNVVCVCTYCCDCVVEHAHSVRPYDI
jgi:hypothetical protein